MNKKTKKIWFGVTVLVVAMFAIVGCGLFDRNSTHIPTNPSTQSNGGQLGNFIAAGGVSTGFSASLQETGFQINIPTPGDYLVSYQMTGVGTYNLVIRVQAPSLIAIGAPGPVEAVFIQRGTLRANPAPLVASGTTLLFNWPMYPWEHLFTPLGVKISLPLSGVSVQMQGSIVIAAVGDSITYGKGSTSGGYVPMLQQKLQAAGFDVIVRKEAVPGEQAASTDARFLSAIVGADIALIMIGTNDIVNTYTCPSPGFCNAAGHVSSMIDKARQAGVVPVVSTVPPIRTSCEYVWPNSDVRSLNSQYASVSQSQAVPLVDNYYPILQYGGDALLVDCVHFNDSGYNVIADRFFNALLAHKLLSL